MINESHGTTKVRTWELRPGGGGGGEDDSGPEQQSTEISDPYSVEPAANTGRGQPQAMRFIGPMTILIGTLSSLGDAGKTRMTPSRSDVLSQR